MKINLRFSLFVASVISIFFFSLTCLVQAQNWTQISTTGSTPTTRYGHTAIYDAANNRTIIFGGFNGSVLNDVWVLSTANGLSDTSAWTQLSPTGTLPPARYSQTAVYDAANNRMTIFGGYDGSLLNDVWVLSTANGLGGTSAWTQLSPTGTLPPSRYSQTAVYDAANNRMTIFGGYNGSQLNDVWVLSNANGLDSTTPAWTQLTPIPDPLYGTPTARQGASAVYDAANNRMTIFAGGTGGSLNDVWLLSNANGLGGSPAWTQFTTTGTNPPARLWHSAVLDTTNNRMTIFAGQHSGGSYLNDVWVLSNANGLDTTTSAWTQLFPTGSAPTTRLLQTAVYDNTNNRMTIFGGYGNAGSLNDLWVLTAANGLNAPKAGFYGIPTSSTGPVQVTFVDTSAFNPTSWNWNFGDGSIDTVDENPIHVYGIVSTPTAYTVQLIVTNSYGTSTMIQSNYIYIYVTTGWVNCMPLPIACSNGLAAAVNGMIYLIGGYTPQENNSLVQIYDPMSYAWSTGTNKPTGVNNLCGGVIENKIYAVGGYNENGASAGLEIYDPQYDTWTTGASLPQPVYGAAGAVVNGNLYVIGGINAAGSYLNTCYAYDPVSDTWSLQASMNYTRGLLGAAAVNGKIYAVGGNDGSDLSYCEEYDPVANVWTVKSSLNAARRGLGVCANGFVYAIGGINNNSEIGVSGLTNSCERYNPLTDTWVLDPTIVPNLNMAKQEFGTVIVNGTIYALGGCWFASYAPYIQTDNEFLSVGIGTADSAPTGLVAIEEITQVQLTWNANTETDVAGYNVYRSTDSTTFTILNGGLVVSTSYFDTNVSNGTTYYYVVTAVNSANFESGYSNEVMSVTPLGPSASFTGMPLSGYGPLTVYFSDNSFILGDNPSWNWSFGDGSTGNIQNPIHIYGTVTSAMVYTVQLIVTTSLGASTSTQMNYIEVTTLLGINDWMNYSKNLPDLKGKKVGNTYLQADMDSPYYWNHSLFE